MHTHHAATQWLSTFQQWAHAVWSVHTKHVTKCTQKGPANSFETFFCCAISFCAHFSVSLAPLRVQLGFRSLCGRFFRVCVHSALNRFAFLCSNWNCSLIFVVFLLYGLWNGKGTIIQSIRICSFCWLLCCECIVLPWLLLDNNFYHIFICLFIWVDKEWISENRLKNHWQSHRRPMRARPHSQFPSKLHKMANKRQQCNQRYNK